MSLRRDMLVELRRRFAVANAMEKSQPRDTDAFTPSWANFFTGYRDALHEVIAWLEAHDE